MTHHVAVFCEEEFNSVEGFASKEEASAYAKGASLGAALYAAGSFAVYFLPDELERMREEQDEDECRDAEDEFNGVVGSPRA